MCFNGFDYIQHGDVFMHNRRHKMKVTASRAKKVFNPIKLELVLENPVEEALFEALVRVDSYELAEFIEQNTTAFQFDDYENAEESLKKAQIRLRDAIYSSAMKNLK